MRWMVGVLAIMLGALFGCSPPTEGPEEVGELVTTWSQAGHEIQDLEAVLARDHDGTTLLRDAAERDAFVAGLDPDLDSSAVEAVDMDEHVLVVGGYAKCDTRGQVLSDPDHQAVWFTVVDPTPDTEIVCEWAPFTGEMWQVPLAQLAGADPSQLHHRPPGEP